MVTAGGMPPSGGWPAPGTREQFVAFLCPTRTGQRKVPRTTGRARRDGGRPGIPFNLRRFLEQIFLCRRIRHILDRRAPAVPVLRLAPDRHGWDGAPGRNRRPVHWGWRGPRVVCAGHGRCQGGPGGARSRAPPRGAGTCVPDVRQAVRERPGGDRRIGRADPRRSARGRQAPRDRIGRPSASGEDLDAGWWRRGPPIWRIRVPPAPGRRRGGRATQIGVDAEGRRSCPLKCGSNALLPLGNRGRAGIARYRTPG